MKEEIREKYRLDKTAFSSFSMEDHGNIDYRYWKHKSAEERLEAAALSIELAFGIKDYWQGKVDRSIFSQRKHPLR